MAGVPIKQLKCFKNCKYPGHNIHGLAVTLLTAESYSGFHGYKKVNFP